MKSIIFLLFVALPLLLTGCDSRNQTSQLIAVSDAESIAVASPDNVRKAETQPVISVSSEPVKLSVPSEDRNQAFALQFVETPECYYYVRHCFSENGMLNFIYFCPRGGTVFYPLCSKPNCKHDNSNCNAFCGIHLGYYDGSLYTNDLDEFPLVKLIKMNPDGTDHQVVAAFDPSGGTGRMGASCAFHHGMFFLFCKPTDTMLPEERSYRLIVVNLADGSQSELASDFYDTAKEVPDRYWYYKDKLYGEVFGSGTESTLIELDISTGTTRTMKAEWISDFYATDSTLYYLVDDLSYADAYVGQASSGFREYDLKTGMVKNCGMPADHIMSALYDEDYIYAQGNYSNDWNDSTLYLLSRDYMLVDQIELKGLGIAAVTSDRIFFCDDNERISFFLMKSQIGSHDLTLIPIETVG